MKKLLSLSIFLSLLTPYFVDAMEALEKIDFYIVPAYDRDSSKPAYEPEAKGYQKKDIRFELWHKENKGNNSMWISVTTEDDNESAPVELQVGDRLISPEKIKQICYYGGSVKGAPCYLFDRTEKVFLTLNNDAIKPQSGKTSVIGAGKAAKKFGSVRRALGTALKSESGVSLHDNITKDEISRQEHSTEYD